MANANPILLLRQVKFGYDPGAVVVDGFSAALRPGRVTTLVGPNAAGKTTLLRLILGLARPWSGSIEFDGVDVFGMSAKLRARRMSYVPQRPGVRFAFTVRQVVAMGGHAAGADRTQQIDQAIEEAGLEGLSGRVFAELSGGQQQRVLLARAQVQSAEGGRVMLLDEPGSHLDLHHRHATMRRLRELAGRGLAVLVVLHDLDLAARYADDAWLMDGGKLVAAGTWDQVLTPELLCPVYRMDIERIAIDGARPLLSARPLEGVTMTCSSKAHHDAND